MIKSVVARTPILVFILMFFALGYTVAHNKVVVVPLGSDSSIKGWAQINSDGTVASCYRCNTDSLQTRTLGTGVYEVDFTPISSSITARPWTASIGNGINGGVTNDSTIALAPRSGDLSSIFVETNDASTGTHLDQAFTILVF